LNSSLLVLVDTHSVGVYRKDVVGLNVGLIERECGLDGLNDVDNDMECGRE
jgi:hypothetical protein